MRYLFNFSGSRRALPVLLTTMFGLYIRNRWFILLSVLSVLCMAAFFVEPLWYLAFPLIWIFAILTLTDFIVLFLPKNYIDAKRILADRWHLGEDNSVMIAVHNKRNIALKIAIIDELPDAFQARKFKLSWEMPAKGSVQKAFFLKPLRRGLYSFGNINVFVATKLGLLERKLVINTPQSVKVYPTTKYLASYQLLAQGNRYGLPGEKKIRKMGSSMEFEQIKEYVMGDDIRTINWKATARRGHMMVNTFTDTRSQQIYCIIDKGRTMKMPFEGMSLMDYAIRAALVFANVALQKHDRAGLITFSSAVDDLIAADNNGRQMQRILEVLYRQETNFADADYESLLNVLHKKLSQRCFLMLFTNFESLSSLERQLPYLRMLAKRHLLCVVFFENTALQSLVDGEAERIEDIYKQTIAERFMFEKKIMVKELRRAGIITILTRPDQLTATVVNNYLELKSRQEL